MAQLKIGLGSKLNEWSYFILWLLVFIPNLQEKEKMDRFVYLSVKRIFLKGGWETLFYLLERTYAYVYLFTL